MTTSRSVVNTYVLVTFLSTLATSLIWGINTLFLLDAGLSNTAAFAANAFFTVGQVIFEVPTGIVADTWGRKTSFVLGCFTLFVSTLFYYLMWRIGAPLVGWILPSVLLGLGFTFFSGATSAWLVDALAFTKYEQAVDSAFAKGQIAGGVAMLTGSFLGGLIAQFTNLGVPYIIRALVLVVTMIVAMWLMKDVGFTPEKTKKPLQQMKAILNDSLNLGLRNSQLKWLMLATPFTFGVVLYVFYAAQPYLLDLYGDKTAYLIAGLTASIVAGVQILGGVLVPHIRKVFSKRTSILIGATTLGVVGLLLMGITQSFWVAIFLIVIFSLSFSGSEPIRQAYLNALIPSKQRATVLSFDSLLGSAGSVVSQPALGKVADVYSYGTSFVVCGVIQACALPFLFLAKKTNSAADKIT